MTDMVPKEHGAGSPFPQVAAGLKREASSLMYGKVNHERWEYIMNIYMQYMSDEAVARGALSLAYPYISIVREANGFPEFTDIPDNSPEQRAFDLGVREAAENIRWLAETKPIKIVKTIMAIEGFQGRNFMGPVENADDEYFYFDDRVANNDAALFYLFTGEYASGLHRPDNPKFAQFKENRGGLVDTELLNRMRRLYQIGSRLGVLHEIYSSS